MYGFAIIFLSYFVFCAAEIWKATHLRAVSYFDGIEEYYSTVRGRAKERATHPVEPADPKQRGRMKKSICRRIFTSHHFRELEIDWLNIDKRRVLEDVKTRRRDVFDFIYDEREDKPHRCSPCSWTDDYVYRNPYRAYLVRFNAREENEYVFRCVAKHRSSDTIQEYFVSQAYNVNTNLSSYPIAGRFVLSNDRDATVPILKVVALAEEAAVLTIDYPRYLDAANIVYLTSRTGHQLSYPSNLDPVCSLSPAEKLRVCTSLFGATQFKKKIKFPATMSSVRLDCEEKTVKLWSSSQYPLKEWVIGCRGIDRAKDPVIYYVSRGSTMNEIYVYRFAGQQMISVYNICRRVSVVDRLKVRINFNAAQPAN